MPNLSTVDWLILLLYCTSVLGIGFSLKPFTDTRGDFFQAGRAQPAWICALAFLAASLGAPEILLMGAAGAQYGLAAACFFALGAVPAMLFLGLYLMPLYYGSGARTVPEYLRLRFDRKTGVLNAVLFVAMSLCTAGLSLYLMATVFQSLHVFDRFFENLGWYQHGSFAVVIALSVLVVAAYVLLGGLAGSIYSQVVQFFLMVAGLLPVVFLGLRGAGGWSGLKASLPAASSGNGPIAIALGLVFAAGFWCTDFRVIQSALAARDVDAARRTPLLAALLRIFVPLLFILPGLVAIGLPTPHSTTTVTTTPDGAIIHQINVVPPQAAAGRGLVPAFLDPRTGQPLHTPTGQPKLDYKMALPNLLLHFLPTGILGLALTALLACCMSGLAANITAVTAIFDCDLYPSNNSSDRRSIGAGRLFTAAALLLSAGIACALHNFGNIVGALLLFFALVNIPLLVAVLFGMFWKRATAAGAFAGLIAGFAATLLHHGLTLPAGATPGIHGGWIAVLHRYPGDLAQDFYAVLAAFSASLLVAFAVSLITAAKAETELAGLVHSLATKPAQAEVNWRKRPESLAATALLLAVIVALFLC